MDVSPTATLDRMIRDQHDAIRYYTRFAAALVGFGVFVIVFAFAFPILFSSLGGSADVFKGLFGLGGAFISSLSTFQLKEVVNRREKIHAFESIKMQLVALQAMPKSKRGRSEERLEELVYEVLKKTVLS